MLVPGSRPLGLRVGMPVVLGAWLDRLALGVSPSEPPGDAAVLEGEAPGVVVVPPAGRGAWRRGRAPGGRRRAGIGHVRRRRYPRRAHRIGDLTRRAARLRAARRV